MRMKAVSPMPVCPFCGVITEIPHENQQTCLEALAVEIARLRSVLEHSASAAVPVPPPEQDDPEET
jgi:hypothetical protein